MSSDITFEKVIGYLLDTPMFERLNEAELAEVLRIMQVRGVRDGQVLFREGDVGDGWYVIFEGELVVTKSDGSAAGREIARLGPRQCVGEMAILDGSPRSANIKASGAATVFRFPRDAFMMLLNEGNLAAYKLVFEMAKVLCQRQRGLTRQLAQLSGELDAIKIQKKIGSLVDDQAPSE